jgi:hypothetical protein
MYNMKKKVPLLIVILIAIADLHQAHAYLDPGTGSMLIQVIIAGALGAAFTLKLYWKRLKGFLSKGKTENDYK